MAEKKPRSARGVLLALVAGLLVFLGTLLGECGLGTGLGPGLKGLGIGTPAATTAASATAPTATAPSATVASASAAASAAPPAACALRLDKSGLQLDGMPVTIAAAVEACRMPGKAELVTTGDAVYGEHEKLRAALHEGGVYILERRP
jgi:hypothetical protein